MTAENKAHFTFFLGEIDESHLGGSMWRVSVSKETDKQGSSGDKAGRLEGHTRDHKS